MRQQYHFRQVNNDVHIWNVNQLLAENRALKAKPWPLNKIKELDENYWFELGGNTPSCRAISEHAKQISDADLSYPILLCHQGRIIDGMHRVCKALQLGYRYIDVIQLEQQVAPHFMNIDASQLEYD